MHRFQYRNNHLYVEQVKVSQIVYKYGTPLYIYSGNAILEQFQKIQQAFSDLNPLICYSAKANSNLSILRLLIKAGAGVDVVSGGELFKALKAGCSPQKIVYAGVGKTPQEIEFALRKKILFINVESYQELEVIEKLAGKLKLKQKVCLRFNPDIDAYYTHKYITTGKKETKFGLDEDTIKKIISHRKRFKNVEIKGIHIHIGSQILELAPFMNAISKAIKLIDNSDIDMEYLNIGGGLGIRYKRDEQPLDIYEYASRIKKLIGRRKIRLIMEPGRFIVGNAGILVTQVIYHKPGINKNFLIVDAGMHLLLRPALYSAYHEIVPLNKFRKRKYHKFDIVGPICESSDFLGKNRKLPEVKPGEYLVVFSTGAYGMCMAFNYNAQPRCREVLVMKNRIYEIRKPETYYDLISKEKIPQFLK